ncbi:MAG: CRISPR-associated endonuclease Cas2 [Candidatus Asgardarchaeia archaeon]
MRAELRELLKDYGGQRLQYSVYELRMSYEGFEKLKPKIIELLKKGKGTVHILKPCKRCYRSIIHISTKFKPSEATEVL